MPGQRHSSSREIRYSRLDGRDRIDRRGNGDERACCREQQCRVQDSAAELKVISRLSSEWSFVFLEAVQSHLVDSNDYAS